MKTSETCDCSCHFGSTIRCTELVSKPCCEGPYKLRKGVGACPDCEAERPDRSVHACARTAKEAGVTWPWWM